MRLHCQHHGMVHPVHGLHDNPSKPQTHRGETRDEDIEPLDLQLFPVYPDARSKRKVFDGDANNIAGRLEPAEFG